MLEYGCWVMDSIHLVLNLGIKVFMVVFLAALLLIPLSLLCSDDFNFDLDFNKNEIGWIKRIVKYYLIVFCMITTLHILIPSGEILKIMLEEC